MDFKSTHEPKNALGYGTLVSSMQTSRLKILAAMALLGFAIAFLIRTPSIAVITEGNSEAKLRSGPEHDIAPFHGSPTYEASIHNFLLFLSHPSNSRCPL